MPTLVLNANVPVSVYGFGHTSLWTIFVDPFGILEWLSLKLDASIVPFIGRWCWPLGPPYRVPLLVTIGDPIPCPKLDEPISQAQIDEVHGKLLAGYQTLFDTHKAAYGWANKTLKFV